MKFVCYTSVALTIFSILEGEYVYEAEDFKVCPGPMESIVRLKFINVNRTTKAVSGFFILKRDFDENVGTTLEVERFTSAGWTSVPFLPLVPNGCKTYVNTFRLGILQFAQHTNMTHMDRCPWPKGNYAINKFVVSTFGRYNLPFTGRFHMKLKFIDMITKANVLCVQLEGNMKKTPE